MKSNCEVCKYREIQQKIKLDHSQKIMKMARPFFVAMGVFIVCLAIVILVAVIRWGL